MFHPNFLVIAPGEQDVLITQDVGSCAQIAAARDDVVRTALREVPLAQVDVGKAHLPAAPQMGTDQVKRSNKKKYKLV